MPLESNSFGGALENLKNPPLERQGRGPISDLQKKRVKTKINVFLHVFFPRGGGPDPPPPGSATGPNHH